MNKKYRTIKDIYDGYYRWLVVILLIVAAFLRIYRISEIPRGLHADEVGMAYDAWSISKFGVDRYLKSYPVYLTNFGGGQSAMYCYLVAIIAKFVPLNELLIRMPGICLSMLTGIFGYLLIRNIRGRKAGIIYLVVFITVPYFTQAARIALDCNLMLGMSVIILYLLEKCLRPDNMGRILPYIGLGITTGLTLYTYALSYMILPIFFICVGIYIIICHKKIRITSVVAMLIPVVVMAVPIVLVLVVNTFNLNDIKIANITMTRLKYYRGGEISLGEIRSNLGWIKRSILTVDNTEFDSFPQFGTLFLFSMPFIIFGGLVTLYRAVREIRRKELLYDGIIVLYAAIVLVTALFIQGVTTYRINSVFFGLAFMIVIAIETLLNSPKKVMQVIGGGVMCLYVVAFLFFAKYYFFEYENDIYPQRLFAEDPTETFEFMDSQDERIRNRLTYVGGVNEAYVYYMLSMHISPYDYDIDTYGNNGDGKPYIFYEKEPCNRACNYIFYLPDDDKRNEYIESGFTEYDMNPYKVYIYKD